MNMIGQKAPDFKAVSYYNGEFKEFELNEHLGKWIVMIFYPVDFSFTWHTELLAVANGYNTLKDLGAEVLTIHLDNRFACEVFGTDPVSELIQEGLPYRTVADESGTIVESYGISSQNFMATFRGQIIINPHGVIESMEVISPTIQIHINEIARQLKMLQKYSV